MITYRNKPAKSLCCILLVPSDIALSSYLSFIVAVNVIVRLMDVLKVKLNKESMHIKNDYILRLIYCH